MLKYNVVPLSLPLFSVKFRRVGNKIFKNYYTVSEKRCHFIFHCNSLNYWLIFIILHQWKHECKLHNHINYLITYLIV